MRLFTCQNCGQVLYFENAACVRCGIRLGYLPAAGTLSAVTPDGRQWIALAAPDRRYRFCENWERSACNWMVEGDGGDPYCLACRHNRTIPDISDPEKHRLWQRIEDAKRRLFYSLIRLRLPVPAPGDGDHEPLMFDFLADAPEPHPAKVMTGHDNGLVTIALAEADDAVRERIRTGMGEPYRTLLGHFRHEVGHYFWDRLVRDGGEFDGFRALFGDEREDYGAALKRHYDNGAPAGWQEAFVSAYATVHPWEDWAETFAHYLHIVDTLETAAVFGMAIRPHVGDAGMAAAIDFDPYGAEPLERLIGGWLPLTFAVNALNRSMGQPDLYPFVLTPKVIAKLGYVHALVHRARPAGADAPEAQLSRPLPRSSG